MNALIKFPTQASKAAEIAPLNSNLSVSKDAPRAAVPDYLEFLPAHLEILETPPSPKASLFLWGLSAMLVALLAWGWFAHLDIHAIAQGRIQPSGRSKVLQPFEPGRVASVLVTNGAKVRAGDLLLELDPTESRADQEASLAHLRSLTAEISRRKAAMDAVQTASDTTNVEFDEMVPDHIRARERNILSSEISQYLAGRATLQAQLAERRALKNRLLSSLTARERLTALLSERVRMKETLQAREVGSRASVIDAAQLLAQEETSIAYERGQVLESDAGAISLERRIEQLKFDFLAQQAQRLSEAHRRWDEVEQTLVKATARMERTRLHAPIDGIVQQVSVHTVGQVVSTGQPLLIVVPIDGALEVEAMVQNRDIAFIELGNQAIIKIDSLPFSRYGTVAGVVRRVSSDAVDEREAGTSDASSYARANSSAASVTGTPRVQNLVYPVTLELERRLVSAQGREVSLSPGMMVTVEIRTGSRRAIDYLLAPLREYASQAGRER